MIQKQVNEEELEEGIERKESRLNHPRKTRGRFRREGGEMPSVAEQMSF